jgi:hypothetical protein
MDLLNADLTTVDTSRSLMKKGPMTFTISEVKMEKSKDNSKDMVVFTFKSKFDTEDTKGGKLNAGYTLIDRIVITPTEKKTEDSILKDLARRREEITGDKSGRFAPIEQYIGKEVEAVVDIEVDKTGEFGDQNRLRKIKPVGSK